MLKLYKRKDIILYEIKKCTRFPGGYRRASIVYSRGKSSGRKLAYSFGNNHPIHIEVGMGKGQFITTLAQQNPEINYIGIEMYDSVLLRAIQKKEALAEEGQELSNLKFMRMDARLLPEVFEKGEVSRIYLNFSDPWPKARHASRRLTSREFLSRYDKILKEDGTIEFKTDNRGLFDFSLEEVPEAGWKLEAHTFDLHHNEE